MSDPLILALDQGTSSSRALVFDRVGGVHAVGQRPLASSFPQPGWVEQSGEEIWATQIAAARDALAAVDLDRITGIAIANQRETALVWEREAITPIAPAIVWQCRRTASVAQELRATHGDEIRLRTGLHPDAYFSGPKIAWTLEHTPRAGNLATGNLAAGTVDSWLIARLTNGEVHAADRTNASRTMLWNLHCEDWDDDLCTWQRVPRGLLPQVHPSRAPDGEFGFSDPRWFDKSLPILAVAGDQQAALHGQGIDQPGAAKCTYGTGAFVLTHAGAATDTTAAPRGLLLTAAADGTALEGGVFTAGSVIQWLRDELRLAPTAPEISDLAAQSSDSGGVAVVPALAGLGAPHWDAQARGLIAGITRGATDTQIARAALEAVAFRVREIVETMESATGPIAELRVDGGMSASDALMQIQADALQRPVARPQMLETTAWGAARLAFEAAGVETASDQNGEDRFHPRADLESEFAYWLRAREAAQTLGAASDQSRPI